MAIFTRFGSEVEVTSQMDDKWCLDLRRVEDKSELKGVHTSELKADGGIQEIVQACKDLEEADSLEMEFEAEIDADRL